MGEENKLKPRQETNIVVIPVDRGQDSMRAFKWYLENLHQSGHKVHVVHCCEVDHPSGKHYPDYALAPEEWDEKLFICNKIGKNICVPYEELMKQHSIKGEVTTKMGRPGKTIVETATELNASMIVMGSRSLGPVARQVLGSVSDYVLTKSNIPVTIVPGPRRLELLWYLLH